MKKYWISFFTVFIIVLAVGCTGGNDSDLEEDPKSPVVSNDEAPSTEVDTTSSTPDEKNEASDLGEAAKEDATNEFEKENETKPLYVLETIDNVGYGLKPINEADNNQVVLLTFDDAPENYGVEIAHILKEKGINAIFFVNGHFISNEAGREKLKTIYDLGFEIGNHTMTHPLLRDISKADQRTEIVELNDLVEEITGERPRFFRAPFGVNTEISRQVIKEENMQAMNWTYGYDFEKEYMEKEALTDIMVNTYLLKPGANLLMHDREWTAAALPEIISGLEAKGYQFVDPKTIQ